MLRDDREYFAARIAAERASARMAASQEIGAIHLTLAHAYEARMSEADRASQSPYHGVGHERRVPGEAD